MTDVEKSEMLPKLEKFRNSTWQVWKNLKFTLFWLWNLFSGNLRYFSQNLYYCRFSDLSFNFVFFLGHMRQKQWSQWGPALGRLRWEVGRVGRWEVGDGEANLDGNINCTHLMSQLCTSFYFCNRVLYLYLNFLSFVL